MATIDDIKREMAALPSRERANDQTVKAKITKLRDAIKQLHFDKGWKWPDIALWLSERDIPITEGTLRLYYYNSGRRKSKARSPSPAEISKELTAVTAAESARTATPAAVAARSSAGVIIEPAAPQRPVPAGRVNPILE